MMAPNLSIYLFLTLISLEIIVWLDNSKSGIYSWFPEKGQNMRFCIILTKQVPGKILSKKILKDPPLWIAKKHLLVKSCVERTSFSDQN